MRRKWASCSSSGALSFDELIRLDGVAPVRVIWLGFALVLAFQVWMVARRFSAAVFAR
jgi:hypothetical protein